MNLLIADDEHIIRQGLQSIDWESIGVNLIASVENGLEAMEVLQSEIVDIILADIRMPGIDGLALAKFVHEQELGSMVILLSGYNDFTYAHKGIQYGVVEYLVKPSDPIEILEAVKRAGKHVEKRRQADMRLKMLEAELEKRQLAFSQDGIVLGEIEYSNTSKRIFRYIAEKYTNAISLSSLSEELHFSTIYLSKVIKKETGYTFLDIVNALRIYDAAEKLRQNGSKLSDIGQSVGIGDSRYFSQVFKKYYGKTPSSYKREPCMPLDAKLTCLIQTLQGRTP